MLKYIGERILAMIITLAVILTLVFCMIRMMPGGIYDELEDITQEQLEALYAKHNLDKPILVQFGIFIKNVVTDWDWGYSLKLSPNKTVWSMLGEKIPITIYENIFSLFISIPLGIGFGILAAIKKNTWIDHTISTLTMVIISVPSFVYAFLIQYFLSFKLGWFPFQMNSGYDYFTWDMIRSMLPAVLSLSFGVIAGFTRTTRAELSEVLTSEFMLLARTKGLTKRQATLRHAMRNSMVVIVPSILSEFIAVLSGSLIIESMFSIPGVGGLYLNSITFQDYDFFMLLSAFYTLVGLTAGIVVDISYGFIDPRIRMGAK
jgi:oligopeptide transport system permease protein